MNTDVAAPTLPVAPELLERLKATVLQRLPRKSFGYLLSPAGSPIATDFVMFEENVRNSAAWKGHFESYGRYFVEHEDAGFVATPEEAWRVQQEIWDKQEVQVGVFHSHLRHPANFSGIDYDMHIERFEELWHMIVSMRNPAFPQIRSYAVSRNCVCEMRHAAPVPDPAEQVGFPLELRHGTGASPQARSAAVSAARSCLGLARDGRPACKDNKAICASIGQLLQIGDDGLIGEFLTHGFLRGSEKRYAEFIAPGMRSLPGARFEMGSEAADRAHFCGEAPRHEVLLTPFRLHETAVTAELYRLFDASTTVSPDAARKPVTGVTWFDAVVFAMWMGCRLPTEAEWEFACGGGAPGEWACDAARDLPRHAWYSENSQGVTHDVGVLQPNRSGLHDLHGNVWEWCFDCYDDEYYGRSPATDPVCLSSPFARRSCRGGSVHALAEMCRTRYRWSEPAAFAASDLGFRLARSDSSPGSRQGGFRADS